MRPFVAIAVAVCICISGTQQLALAANLRGAAGQKLSCGSPPSVFQGKVRMGGDSATYECDKGTYMVGSKSLRCNRLGVWSGTPPECRVFYSDKKDNSFKNNDPGYQLLLRLDTRSTAEAFQSTCNRYDIELTSFSSNYDASARQLTLSTSISNNNVELG
ncbi:hypothetical protein PINS_up020966 [Pythium insidiosum]|nr:hypothetical protein PINS_up020966 [Pythium insidiosum]